MEGSLAGANHPMLGRRFALSGTVALGPEHVNSYIACDATSLVFLTLPPAAGVAGGAYILVGNAIMDSEDIVVTPAGTDTLQFGTIASATIDEEVPFSGTLFVRMNDQLLPPSSVNSWFALTLT